MTKKSGPGDGVVFTSRHRGREWKRRGWKWREWKGLRMGKAHAQTDSGDWRVFGDDAVGQDLTPLIPSLARNAVTFFGVN